MRPEFEGIGAEGFVVLDVDSGNNLAYFGEEAQAESYVVDLVENGWRGREDLLALVAFDKSGFGVASLLGSEILPADRA
jgi:hypothetical protein